MADYHKHRAEASIEEALRMAGNGCSKTATVHALCAIANAILSTQSEPVGVFASDGKPVYPGMFTWPTREGGENV